MIIIQIVHAWPCKINTQHCNYPELSSLNQNITQRVKHEQFSNVLVVPCELFTIQNIPRNVWMRTPHSCITIFMHIHSGLCNYLDVCVPGSPAGLTWWTWFTFPNLSLFSSETSYIHFPMIWCNFASLLHVFIIVISHPYFIGAWYAMQLNLITASNSSVQITLHRDWAGWFTFCVGTIPSNLSHISVSHSDLQ